MYYNIILLALILIVILVGVVYTGTWNLWSQGISLWVVFGVCVVYVIEDRIKENQSFAPGIKQPFLQALCIVTKVLVVVEQILFIQWLTKYPKYNLGLAIPAYVFLIGTVIHYCGVPIWLRSLLWVNSRKKSGPVRTPLKGSTHDQGLAPSENVTEKDKRSGKGFSLVSVLLVLGTLFVISTFSIVAVTIVKDFGVYIIADIKGSSIAAALWAWFVAPVAICLMIVSYLSKSDKWVRWIVLRTNAVALVGFTLLVIADSFL